MQREGSDLVLQDRDRLSQAGKHKRPEGCQARQGYAQGKLAEMHGMSDLWGRRWASALRIVSRGSSLAV